MELKNNDIIKFKGDMFIVVEKMETESNEHYVLLYSLAQKGAVTICKEEKEEGVLTKVQNEYLFTKLMQNFSELIKSRMLKEHQIRIVDDENDNQ